MATLGLNAAERDAVEQFRKDVVEPSMTSLVILDFWAEWCGPCKQLTPVLEKVAAAYADRGVVLAKVNVDENKYIASQFRVQSIPTVYAIFQGQPVADLTQARTEAALGKMLDQILKQLPVQGEAQALEAEIEPLLAMGEDVLAGGDGLRAVGIFAQIVEMVPENPAAHAGLIRAHVAAGDLEAAQKALASLPDDVRKQSLIERAEAALSLARDAVPAEDLSGLRAEVETAPDNHAKRLELATALMSSDRDAAADHLLHIVAADREWNDGAARAQLLKLFDVVGIEDPWVSAQRRRLSAVLFT